ncbi:glycosyltransferase family 4 protein [Falsiroseomonas ponticola]|uniref:glycosyltransferase family 4 protein n=1 Tax=Falsiroseomonas ponticola TaxID=2786951 RepID=UPI001933571B|nr:glycosyltransferase family 4 protein [Roseomonas ponticola]
MIAIAPRIAPRLAIVMSHAQRSMGGAMREAVLARAFARQGLEVRVFRLHGGEALEEETVLDGAVRATFCPADNPQDIPHRQVSASLKAELRAFAPGLVLYKGLGYRVNADTQAALEPGTACGFIVGGGVTDPLLDRASLVLGEYREQLSQHFRPLFRRGQALVLPKYVDLAEAGEGRPVPLADAACDIINVGNFSDARKNQVVLVPLAARHRVTLVGGGTGLGEFRRSVPGRLRARMTFAGRLPHPAVFAALRGARLMVHTSTMDGLPRATVEAMACGVPVIAYRSTIQGGIPHGTAGLLVAEAALPHAVEMVLADDELRIRMGQQARRHVEKHHGVPAIEAAAGEVLKLLG